MVINRRGIIKFWASAPPATPRRAGYTYLSFNRPSFPDVATLSPEEKDLLRPVIMANSQYLLADIWANPKVTQ
jgi:hypothetical protein